MQQHLQAAKDGLLAQSHDNKLEFLRSILGINASILVAVVGLVFILYQIDRYNKFKRINYAYLITYVIAGVVIGLACPTVYLHSADPTNANPLYILSALSIFILFVVSTIYLFMALHSMSTVRTIKRFKYRSGVILKLRLLYAKIYNFAIKVLLKITKKHEKFKKKSIWNIGKAENPLAQINQDTCLQHGVIMQESDLAQLSPLSTRVDLLVRMAATAVDADDIKVFRLIVARYMQLLRKSDDFKTEYSFDVESIADILIRKNRNELYDLLTDDMGMALVKNKMALDKLDDRNGKLYASVLYRYVNKGDDVESVQRAVTRLMNLHFAILNTDKDSENGKWFYTGDVCNMYEPQSALRIAEKQQRYSLWLMYEKANYFAHHGAEVKNIGIAVTYMRLISNIGIIGRVYDYHCGATDCPKTTYQHARETFEELAGYWTDTFDKADSKRYTSSYKEALEKLVGYDIDMDVGKRKLVITDKPKIVMTMRLGPSKATSSEDRIDYSNLDKESLQRLMNSRKATW